MPFTQAKLIIILNSSLTSIETDQFFNSTWERSHCHISFIPPPPRPVLISPSCIQIQHQKVNLGQNIKLSVFETELFLLILKWSIYSSFHLQTLPGYASLLDTKPCVFGKPGLCPWMSEPASLMICSWKHSTDVKPKKKKKGSRIKGVRVPNAASNRGPLQRLKSHLWMIRHNFLTQQNKQ